MKQKAIFLDRDGVLISNLNHYYIWKPDQVQFVDGIFGNLQALSEKGFQFFIVTNQGGIAKGLYSKKDVQELHQYLIETFRSNQIEISEIAVCPHQPEVEKCLCRKPESLLPEKLLAKHGISREDSYFIGDSETDMEAARKAGIRGIRVAPNKNMFATISFLIR